MQEDMVQIRLVHLEIADGTTNALNALEDEGQLLHHIVNEADESIAGCVPFHARWGRNENTLRLDRNFATRAYGRGNQLLNRAVGYHLSVIDDHDPIASRFGFIEMVCGKDNACPFLIEFIKHVKNALPTLRVHANGGLIQQQHIRAMQYSARDVNTTFHAT